MRAADRVDDRRQRVELGRRAVELPAAMVGDDEAVDAALDGQPGLVRMQHALEDQRPAPDLAQLLDILPGHRGIEQRRHAAGERADVGRLARPHIVAEGDALQFAPHAPEPAGLERHGQIFRRPEARRDGEAVADVALAVAEHLVVDGEHQRIVAAGRRALGQLAREAAVAVDEHLHPARRGAGRRQLLQRADRAVAEAEARAGRRRGARRAALAIRPEQAGEAGRPDDDRQGQPSCRTA